MADDYGNATPDDFVEPGGRGKVRTFQLVVEDLEFTIDAGEDAFVFKAPPIIPPIILVEISKYSAAASDRSDPEKMLNAIVDIFELLLYPASGEEFGRRLKSRERPIDLNRQAVPIMHWLLEEYGLRPTAQSSTSASGSDVPESGADSTAGAQPAE